MNVERIKINRLILQPFTLADVDEVHRLWVKPGMRKYLWDDEIIPHEKAKEVVAESVALFKDNGFGLWAMGCNFS